MNKIGFLLILLAFLVLGACQNNTSKSGKTTKNSIEKTLSQDTAKAKLPVMTFTETVHNFGNMVQGEIVKYNFHFKNTGDADLVISKVRSTCGCTVGAYPHQPVKPGGEGNLKVTFNSSYKLGYQNKGIMIFANTQPKRTLISIRAQVKLPNGK